MCKQSGKYTIQNQLRALPLLTSCLVTTSNVSGASVCHRLTLAGKHNLCFSHSCQHKPPKANTGSKAMSWTQPCWWLLPGFQTMFTWQIQIRHSVQRRDEKSENCCNKKEGFYPIMYSHARRQYMKAHRHLVWHSCKDCLHNRFEFSFREASSLSFLMGPASKEI